MGLLDNHDGLMASPTFRIGLGLLSGGGQSSNFGQILQNAMQGSDDWKMRQAKMAQEAQQAQMQKMQMDQMQAQMAQTQKMQGLTQQFAKPEGFDYGGYANAMAGVDPMKAMEIQKSLAKQGPEYSTAPQYDQNGRAFILAKDGSMKYLDGVKARDKLEEVRLGDKVAFRSPYSTEMQGSMPVGQSADSRASTAVAWANNAATLRGQNMTDARARDMNDITRGEKKKIEELTKGGQIASFDTMLGTLDRLGSHPGLSRSVGIVGAFPTMPGSESANFKAELDTFQSQAFIPMVSQLKGMGALSDAEGKKLTAAVGALNPNMGEKAFRESVGRITSEMAAARERVSGVPTNLPSKAAEPGNVMSALPTANASNKGRKIRDTTTGKILVSNGMTWTEAP